MDRIEREKEWHNDEAHKDAREKVRKYNIVLTDMKNHFKKLIQEKSDKNNTVFLDYGCGIGIRLLDYYECIKKGVGIDISEVRIEEAKAKLKENNITNIEFFTMDAMNTRFDEGEFDIIRGSAILHHLDLKLSLIEIKRILKDDGYAFFIEPLDTNPIIKLYRKITPQARTEDEQPLRIKDIKMIKKIFPNTEMTYYAFLTLLAIPFRMKKSFKIIYSILNIIDKIILSKWSPFKWLGWYCILILKK